MPAWYIFYFDKWNLLDNTQGGKKEDQIPSFPLTHSCQNVIQHLKCSFTEFCSRYLIKTTCKKEVVVLLVQFLFNKQCSSLHESPVLEIYMYNALYTYSVSHRKRLCCSVGKNRLEYTITSESQNTLLTDNISIST